MLALAGFVRGSTAFLRGDLGGALAAAEGGLAVLSALPEPDQQREETLRLQLLLQVGPAAADFGDHERARQAFQEALELAEARGAAVNHTWALWGLALVAWRRGDAAEADRQARQCLRLLRDTGTPDAYLTVLAIEVLAWVAADRQQHRRGASLLGVAGTVLANLGRALAPSMRAGHDACERRTRAALGEAEFTDAVRHGRHLPAEGALALALDEPHRAAPPRAGTGAVALTRRERQVAEIVAEGRSNKEIATMLFISQRTVESHVEHILGKLGFTSRAQIAAWTADQRRAH